MWLEAIFPAEDLRRTLSEIAPLEIRLGDDGGELALDAPSEVTLVADQGVRIVCAARLHWPVLGVSVPVTMKSLVVLLRPTIEAHEGKDALVFKLEIEHADFSMVPAVIDTRITSLVNEELAKKGVELSWDYAQTLNHVFQLPDLLKPAEALSLTITGAVVKVTTEALGLAIAIRSDVKRGGARDEAIEANGTPPPSKAAAPVAPSTTATPATTATTAAAPLLSPAAFGVRAILGAVAIGAVFALGRASRPRSSRLLG